MMRAGAILVLFLAIPGLFGCVSVDERQIRPGVFVISTLASEFINTEDRARVILNLRALELCPKGFMRFSEGRTVDASDIEIVTWQVACVT